MSDTIPNNGFLVRTRSMLRRALKDVINVTNLGRAKTLRPDLPDDDLKTLKQLIDVSLSGRGGEALARGNAAELGRYYLDLNEIGQIKFFSLLAKEYGVSSDQLKFAMDAVRSSEDNTMDYELAVNKLRECLLSPRTKLFRQFNSLDHGIKFLVDMRADLRKLIHNHPELRSVDNELRSLLSGWFDAGFLELRNVTWSAPADLLEKLINYEAVHEIESWTDLKNRLESDRRCYAFFHPNMPDEPLIFVEVALVDGIAGNVQDLLDATAPTENPEKANAAIFYSISNAQQGLSGVSFGDFLIKQVLDKLSHELPNIKTFATLSPIPGFGEWLVGLCNSGKSFLTNDQLVKLNSLSSNQNDNHVLLSLLDHKNWHENIDICKTLEPIMLRLAADYLLNQRRKKKGTALDSVAHFHLSNGAQIEKINWLADCSNRGIKQSAGMMVNYLYGVEQILENHESYITGREIPASNAVKLLI
jgi:malonyl-CoA decarboxylase